MKHTVFILWLFILSCPSFSQNCCGNIGFELGDFSGWQGGTGTSYLGPNSTFNYCVPNALWTPGLAPGPLNEPSNCVNPIFAQHVLYNNPAQLDSVSMDSCFTVVSPLGGYSARIGNHDAGCGAAFLEYSFVVDSCYSGIIFSYAVILQEAHSCTETPGFCVGFFDVNDQLLPGPCGSYCVSSFPGDPNFQLFQMSPGCISFYYNCWDVIAVDLSGYVGQTIKLRYASYDCTLCAHMGYAYVDATCQKMEVSVNFCTNAPQAVLTAPAFFSGYQWYDHDNNPLTGDTLQTLTVNNPVAGDTFYVELESRNGCPATLMVIVNPHDLSANANTTGVSCAGIDDGILSASPAGGSGSYTYAWNTTPAAGTQSVTNVPPGQYIVVVTDSLGCSDADTVIVAAAAVLTDTLPRQTSMCAGDPMALLSAPGNGYNYQ